MVSRSHTHANNNKEHLAKSKPSLYVTVLFRISLFVYRRLFLFAVILANNWPFIDIILQNKFPLNERNTLKIYRVSLEAVWLHTYIELNMCLRMPYTLNNVSTWNGKWIVRLLLLFYLKQKERKKNQQNKPTNKQNSREWASEWVSIWLNYKLNQTMRCE